MCKNVTDKDGNRKTPHEQQGKPAGSNITLSDAVGCRRRGSFSPQQKCLVTMCHNAVFTETVINVEEAITFTADVDYFRNEVTGLNRIRKEDGSKMEYTPELPGVGEKVTLELLKDLMYASGVLRTAKQLARNPQLRTFYDPSISVGENRNALAARLMKLKKAFGEDARSPWYFVVRRKGYAVGWNVERSWCIVEWLAEAMHSA